ncbi:MAG: hypothetical protein IPM64_03285 [Phycisphaerales bacterium]|nr:hypothetical protein [Phycisphaerales bacterium]
MLNRLIGIFCVAAMLLANGALVFREFVPRWLAGEPPQNDAMRMRPGEVRRVQYAIKESGGRTVGRSWTVSSANLAPALVVDSYTLIDGVAMPDGTTPRVRLHMSLHYQSDDIPEKILLELDALSQRLTLTGEPVPPNFVFQWGLIDRRGEFTVPSDSMRALGDVFKPFDRLPGLYEGRMWRHNVLDPLTRLMPNWLGNGMSSTSVLVKVTARETIRHNGTDVEAFRVEAPSAVAWVHPDGRVLRQQVELPVFGTLQLIEEPWNNESYARVRDLVFSPLEGEDHRP